MQVYIRHINDADGADCGEMNPEQLNHFCWHLKNQGIYDGEELHLDITIDTQYVYSGDEFFCELIWYDNE